MPGSTSAPAPACPVCRARRWSNVRFKPERMSGKSGNRFSDKDMRKPAKLEQCSAASIADAAQAVTKGPHARQLFAFDSFFGWLCERNGAMLPARDHGVSSFDWAPLGGAPLFPRRAQPASPPVEPFPTLARQRKGPATGPFAREFVPCCRPSLCCRPSPWNSSG
jgi:hypothetical protein